LEKESKEYAKEEHRKKDEESRNSEIVPMDIDIPEISIVDASGHAKFGGLILGLGTPFKPNDVPNLRKFVYDKASGNIVQEKEKKVSVIVGTRFWSSHRPHNRTCQQRSNIHSLSWIHFLEHHRG
jgi:hypothetical protein